MIKNRELDYLRCAILCLPPSLCRGHVLIILAVAALPVLLSIYFTLCIDCIVRERCDGFVHRLWCVGLWDDIELVVCIDCLEVIRILRTYQSELSEPAKNTYRRCGIAKFV